MSPGFLKADRRDSMAHIIAQGGILAGIALVMASIGNLFPVLEILQYLALTPIIIAGIQRGTLFSAEVALAAAALVCTCWGFFPSGLFFMISTVPLGIVLGYLFRRKSAPAVILLASVLMLTVSLGILLYLSIKFFGMDIEKEAVAMAKSYNLFSGQMTSFFHETVPGPLKCYASTRTPEQILDAIYRIAPTAMFLTALCYAFYVWLFNAYFLRRIGLLDGRDNLFVAIFQFFQFPPFMLLILAAGMVLNGTARLHHSAVLSMIGLNIIWCLSILFYFRGLFLINFIIRKRLNKALHLLLFLFSVTIGIPLITFAGIAATLVPGRLVAAPSTGR